MFSVKRSVALCLAITTILLTIPRETVRAADTAESVALFRAYPGLKKTIHHTPLGNFPTPVIKLENLGTVLGAPKLYLKNDSDSGLLFGGNKVRKLEFLLGDALAAKAQGVLTMGYAGSNHTTATAAYCHQLGLRCVCLHMPQERTSYAQRNLLLSHHFGADLTYCHSRGLRDKAMVEKNQQFLDETGTPLYLIPTGGSNEIGTLGFVNAAFELKEQIAAGVLPEPDVMYVALGSCGTAAGLILGLKAAGLKTVVVPVCIEPDIDSSAPKGHAVKTADLINETAATLHKADSTFPFITITPDDICINHKFVGAGYALISPEAKEAISLLGIADGIKLDGTYTGKTCAALLADIAADETLREKTILFWNSFCAGDFLNITKGIDYKALPRDYQTYFTCPLQNGDQGV